MIDVYIEICRYDIDLPFYANIGDAGMDIRSAVDVTIYPQDTVIIPVGFKLAIPSGYEIQVRPRSGLSVKTPLRVSNSPGTIDSGYRGEVGVIITNTSSFGGNDFYDINTKGNKLGIYKINKGDRIAQIILNKVPTINFVLTDNVSDIGTNRGGGFGSTGTR